MTKKQTTQIATVDLTRRTTNSPVSIDVSSIVEVIPLRDGSSIQTQGAGNNHLVIAVTEPATEVRRRIATATQLAAAVA
jgi:hypothetical protein